MLGAIATATLFASAPQGDLQDARGKLYRQGTDWMITQNTSRRECVLISVTQRLKGPNKDGQPMLIVTVMWSPADNTVSYILASDIFPSMGLNEGSPFSIMFHNSGKPTRVWHELQPEPVRLLGKPALKMTLKDDEFAERLEKSEAFGIFSLIGGKYEHVYSQEPTTIREQGRALRDCGEGVL